MYGGRDHHRNDHYNNSGRIPPRWLKCPRKSNGFVGDIFLVFKTPLSAKYDEYVPPEYRFKTTMVTHYFKNLADKLGLWIDLTNTDRYYPKEEVENEGIRYMKMNCQGREGPPTEEQTNLFIRICKTFLDKNPNQKIGVHCTHGFNRSGFLICAFLVAEFDWGVQTALTAFAKMRPPGIYKQDYINRLCELYADEEDLSPPKRPELPDWCFDDSDVTDDDGFANNNNKFHRGAGSGFSGSPPSSSTATDNNHKNNSSSGHKRSYDLMSKESPSNSSKGSRDGPPNKRRYEFVKQNPTFMVGVSGVEPVTDRQEISRIQSKVQFMCDWHSTGFPGSQPVSMDIRNIGFLAENPYMVSWKADGTRYLMLIEDRDKIYFIDRDNCIFQVSGMTFPYRKNPEEHLTETLVDGEMVLDKHEDKTFPRYLIYDIIKFRGEEVGKTEFRTRLLCIEKEIVNERYRAISNGEICREAEPFGVRLKQFWYLEKTEDVLRGSLTQQLPHEPDGAIFQPIKEPYIPGRCDYVLKWKPPELNTIDFRLKIYTQTGEGLLPKKIGQLFVGSLNTPFCQLKKVTKEVAKLDGKIVECRYDRVDGWTFLRERTDKSFPNAYTTAESVLSTIQQPVTMDYLLDFIRRHQYRKP